MICKIRKWELSDAADLATALSNRKIQDNLRNFGLVLDRSLQILGFMVNYDVYRFFIQNCKWE